MFLTSRIKIDDVNGKVSLENRFSRQVVN